MLITLVIAFTLHEFMHAWMASFFGDDTAKNAGRVTLNPLKHLDVFGTLLIFIAGIGWAKPVPVNSSYFATRRIQSIIVSLVGPLSNFVLAFIGFSIIYFLPVNHSFESFLNIFVSLNVVLGVFNLLPLPPLDGYRIISSLFPTKMQMKLRPLETYGSIVFLVVMLTPIGDLTIIPFISNSIGIVINSFYSFYELFLP
ncbi:site-2 protease family protein [Paenisporosarcina sp. OV554]|uniref:site-2 protease family protein n=1 Tax=Paenisporosarcina sp. OV554 TaxID=2135694 RepID=UPI000D4FC887|nr:site-2 protease family protein [Paenisporosarcina sp. OV554]PUB16838.1 Zn-dependent protease [Paenisporosarcina sp. OV554]